MEIDLELPSDEQEKVNPESTPTVVFEESADGVDVKDKDVVCPITNGHINEVSGPSIDENATCGEDQMNVDKRVITDPHKGLEFESKEAAYSFYREYARSVGFGITIKASRRSKKSGKFIDVKIACSRFGSKRESNSTTNPRSCPKTDCKAGMHMKRQDEKWVICSFVKEHNHEICPDDFNHPIKGGNKQAATACSQKKGLQLALDESDVQSMLEHFMCMQDENPNFFYAMDFDNESRLKSVFWVDAKARHDYSSFYDVVVFDTFYITGNYRVPFIPIIGVNNHFDFVMLGCALIGDVTKSDYTWLVRTWLKAMGGQAPGVVITDQETSLNEAVADVLPGTQHCFCLWHVLTRIPEKLGSLTDQNEDFMKKFSKCIYRSWTEEQFEKRWRSMVDEFKLRENEWFQSLHEDRKKWAPTYIRDVSLAGMCTIERSESIISSFDKYMHQETTFKEFLEQYKAFLEDRYDRESKTGFETQPTLKSSSPFEKQMSSIYTDEIFKKFQIEVLGTGSCNLEKEGEDESSVIFRVNDSEEHQHFLVAWNEAELCLRCLCRSFEYRGFLCRHVMLVLQMFGVLSIPSHYILKRWTKEARIGQFGREKPSLINNRVQRFNDLCKRAAKLSEEGSLSEEAYNIVFRALEEILKHCVGVNGSVKGVLENNMLAIHGFVDVEEDDHGSVNKLSKKKKSCKRRKVHSESEGTTNGMLEGCQQMESSNSRAHVLDNCYIPQHDMQGMEPGSRAQTLDGYYGAQQNMQGLGQLNSNSLVRDGYYSNQQAMQGLGQLHPISTRISHYGAHQNMQGLLQGQLGFRTPTMQGCFDIPEGLHDLDQSEGSTQFRSIASKHLHDKHLAR